MFDGANKWLSERIQKNRQEKRGEIRVSAAGLHVIKGGSEQEVVSWDEIVEVHAIRTDAFIGDNLGLVIRSSGGAQLTVMEFDPAWKEVTSAIGEYLPRSVPYAEWSLTTAFGEQKGPVIVYRKLGE